jgi:hypothetical protein
MLALVGPSIVSPVVNSVFLIVMFLAPAPIAGPPAEVILRPQVCVKLVRAPSIVKP